MATQTYKRERRWKDADLQVQRLTLTNATTAAPGAYVEDNGSGGAVLTGTLTTASALTLTGGLTLSGGFTLTGAFTRAGQEYQLSGPPKAGATAGWVVADATNLYEATLPASQTGATLVVPVRGLKVGSTITAFKVELQIESAGGTVTVDADLRKLTNAAGDPVDASVGAITQISVTADTASEAAKTGLAEVVAATEWLYILITATTAAATDIRYLGATVTVTES